MPLNLRLIVHAILEEYALPRENDHGVAHWARVLENGLRLAGATGGNVGPDFVKEEWGTDLETPP
jgi:uncharacterized protein